MYRKGLRSSRDQEVYPPLRNNFAIIGSVYLPRIFTSSSSPNTNLLIVIDDPYVELLMLLIGRYWDISLVAISLVARWFGGDLSGS